jgi:uncharacterized protein YkwD
VTRLKKRSMVLVLAALVALGATACVPDTGPPPADPLANGMFNAMNRDRANYGLPPLTWSPRLGDTTGPHSYAMSQSNYLYHSNLGGLLSSPDYQNFWTLGENVLVGPGNMSADAMESVWMNSPGHRANILSWNFNTVGVGYWRGADGRVWATVIFGGHY